MYLEEKQIPRPHTDTYIDVMLGKIAEQVETLSLSTSYQAHAYGGNCIAGIVHRVCGRRSYEIYGIIHERISPHPYNSQSPAKEVIEWWNKTLPNKEALLEKLRPL